MEDSEIIERVEAWFPKAKTYWEPHHNRFRNIKQFVRAHGPHAQWEETEWNDRQAVNPPRLTLTENLLGPFCNQVANDLKQSDFGALIKPKDSGTDVQMADERQSLHRGVQQIGNFRDALNWAIDDLIDGGLGAWRFVTKHRDPLSFEKEIDYLECDPERLFHGDGTHRRSDFSDVTDSLYYQPYSKEAFKAEFGVDPDLFLGKGDISTVWGTQATGPWVSEYFFKEETDETLVLCTKEQAFLPLLQEAGLKPGEAYFLSDFKDKLKELAASVSMKPEDFIATDENGDPITRKTKKCQVWWAKLAHKQVLKKEKWPGYFIPTFLATGREVTVNGEKRYYGLAEPAVDVQKAHNYAFSALVERAGQAPKSQTWMALESMDPAYQKIYDNLNVWNGVVPWKSRDGKGNQLPKPEREQPITSDPAFINLRQMTLQGIRDVLGMWETSLGAQSQEKSGVAIQTRERHADTGNSDWGMHLARAAEHCFRATDEVLNKVYDVPTQVLIVGEDDKEEVMTVAALEANDPNPNGYHDLNRGKYHILCKMAPSADTKRDQQIQGMDLLFKANPALSTALAPEYIAIQDWKNAPKMAQVAKAVRAAQFPNVNFEDPEGQIPPQVQQHLQQMQQQVQALQQQLQEVGPKMQQAQQEAQRLQIENQSIKADKQLEERKVRVTEFQADTQRMLVEFQTQKIQGEMILKADDQQHQQTIDNAKTVHEIQQDRIDSAHEQRMAAHDANHSAVTVALQVQDQAHQHEQDAKKLDLEKQKQKQTQAAKTAQAGPTGGKPGQSPKPGVKQA